MRYVSLRGGYSLVEVLTVIVIVSILAALASLGVYETIREGTLSRERDTLLANIEEAKARSISSRPSGIQFVDGGASYQIIAMRGECANTAPVKLCITDTDCTASGSFCSLGNFRYDGTTGKIQVLSTHELGNGVTVSWNRVTSAGECSSAADKLLWFDRKGVPRCTNWGLGMSTLTVTMGGRSKTVIIDSAGRTRYEN